LTCCKNFDGHIGGDYYINELRELEEGLEYLGGCAITDDDLRRSIAVYNENRRLIRKVYAFRIAYPWKAPSSEVYLLMRAGMVLPVEEHSQLLLDYLAAAETEERRMRDNWQVVLHGAFCEQPPLNLIKSIELSGCYIVDDDFMMVNRWPNAWMSRWRKPSWSAPVTDASVCRFRKTISVPRFSATGWAPI
jgi:benzoyl-CoA reductase subunit C